MQIGRLPHIPVVTTIYREGSCPTGTMIRSDVGAGDAVPSAIRPSRGFFLSEARDFDRISPDDVLMPGSHHGVDAASIGKG